MKYVDEKNVTPLELPGRTLTVLFSPDNGSEYMTCLTAKVPAGGVLPWHLHDTSDEIIYILQGEGVALHESLKEPIGIYPGMTLFMPKGKKHSIENKGAGEMVLYCTFSPAIKFSPPKP
jgi:quercetin dioxygenase-like cupin family protein